MARKPSDIVQYKLRIREETRRRLEHAAKKRGVSVNYEMSSRIEQSFARAAERTIDQVAESINIRWARVEDAFHKLDNQGALLRAAEELLAAVQPLLSSLDAPRREAITKAVERVQKVTKLIDNEAMLLARMSMSVGAK